MRVLTLSLMLFCSMLKSPEAPTWYVSNRFATEPAGFGDALMLDAYMRYDSNAYNESSNPEVSTYLQWKELCTIITGRELSLLESATMVTCWILLRRELVVDSLLYYTI